MNLLKVLAIVLYATLWRKSDTVPRFVNPTDISFVLREESPNNAVLFSIANNSKHNRARAYKHVAAQLIDILLVISGQIELNPGPKHNIKFPCGECSKAVRWGQKAIACDTCDKRFHSTCIEMNSFIYDVYENSSDLPWECCNCGVKNISTSLFNSSIDSSTDSNLSPQRDAPKRTPTQLKILCINFRSVWGKKEQIEEALFEDEVDIVIGSETHLDRSISKAEFLPPTYKSETWKKKTRIVLFSYRNQAVNSIVGPELQRMGL